MDTKRLVPKILLGIITLIIAAYCLFRFLPLLSGPDLVLISPAKNITTTESFVDLVIATQRVSQMHIQGLPIDIEKNNTTTYRYYLSQGMNNITIEASDTYETTKKIAFFVLKK